jgi:bifunctional enzyme CysN/CysC
VSQASLVRIALVGHVDHGKSTLVGRLLYDTDSLMQGVAKHVEKTSQSRGREVEWAFVTDSLQVERDMGVTVDVSFIRFATPRRRFLLIDAPGHHEFLKNMVSGAAQSDAAVLVVDAAEGVREQTRRHGFLLHLLGLRQIAVAINKMDLVDFSEARFTEVRDELCAHLATVGVSPSVIVPIAARDGDNVAVRSKRMAWYRGPTLLETLEGFRPLAAIEDLPLRLAVQDVYRTETTRILVGRIASGKLSVGDTVLLSPSNKTSRIQSIERWSSRGEPLPQEASAGMAVGITLSDALFVERGDVVSHVDAAPMESPTFRARIFWLSNTPLIQGRRLELRLGTTAAPVEIEKIERVINGSELSERADPAAQPGDVVDAVLRARRMLILDAYAQNPSMGRFVLAENGIIVAGGVIDLQGVRDQRPKINPTSANITWVDHRVDVSSRTARNAHRGGVVWLTGLSGAGKSTLAMATESLMFQKGYQVFVLDGDNLRHGLSADLGFSAADRRENIRRVGEVAALFAEAGLLVITAFISPFQSDRDLARAAAQRKESSAGFHEIYVRCDLNTLEKRDPKGLYRRARAGEIAEFTGISAPYDEPPAPELVIDTATDSVEDCLARLTSYIERHFGAGGSG